MQVLPQLRSKDGWRGVSMMEFLKALIAMFLFMFFVAGVCAKYDIPLPSYDTQVLSLAIVAAGALAHSEK